MFEYDRLDLAFEVQRRKIDDELPRFSQLLSRAPPTCPAQTIPRDVDSASSGYGSFGGTPLASPHSNAAAVLSLLPIHVQRAFNNEGYSLEYLESNGLGTAGTNLAKTQFQPVDESNGPAPQDDGLTDEDIRDFEMLLLSPKKAPPSKYQCHICYRTGHYISDCPQRFNNVYDELTPYQGRKKCYGEFQCQQCKRKWTSQNSVANEAQSCIKCHVAVFPHKQLPVEKAVSMGLIKAQKAPPAKLAPIGHGRPH